MYYSKYSSMVLQQYYPALVVYYTIVVIDKVLACAVSIRDRCRRH